MSTVRARIVAGDALVRDVVSSVCRRAAIEMADEAEVVVLADPHPDDWTAARRSSSAVVVMSTLGGDGIDMVDAVANGALAVLDADCAADDLVAALRAAASGRAYFDSEQAAALAAALRGDEPSPRRPPVLTARELEILRSIDSGESVKQTAAALGIARKTVENLQSRLFAKLGVRNRAHAVVRAHALRLLDA